MTAPSAPAAQTLNDELHGVRAYIASVAPASAVDAIQADIDVLLDNHTASHAVQVGQRAPDFTLPGADGASVQLSALLADSPVVLVFYRGEWCPYCNLTLRSYQVRYEDFVARGAQIVAVSLQTPERSRNVVQSNALTFPVVTDAGGEVAKQYGLVFQVGEALRPHLTGLGANVPDFNGDSTWQLPIPAVYVIGRDGLIVEAFIDADFRNRPETDTVLAALPE